MTETVSRETYLRLRSKLAKSSGVNGELRACPIVVSLTTIPQRIGKVHLCIESLLAQSFKPGAIMLWLKEGDSAEKRLPDSLQRLRKRGLQIRFCKDIRSYCKIIYTLELHPESIIVTADDDVLYPRNWLKGLYDAYEQEPACVHCYRAHLMLTDPDGRLKPFEHWGWESRGVQGPSRLLFPTGRDGCLYPPGCLHQRVLDEDDFLRLCPTGDDIWLKAMSLMNGVACRKVDPLHQRLLSIRGSQQTALHHHNVGKGKYDEQIQAVFDHFDLLGLLREEAATLSDARKRPTGR